MLSVVENNLSEVSEISDFSKSVISEVSGDSEIWISPSRNSVSPPS
jgi:hypothetical protein